MQVIFYILFFLIILLFSLKNSNENFSNEIDFTKCSDAFKKPNIFLKSINSKLVQQSDNSEFIPILFVFIKKIIDDLLAKNEVLNKLKINVLKKETELVKDGFNIPSTPLDFNIIENNNPIKFVDLGVTIDGNRIFNLSSFLDDIEFKTYNDKTILVGEGLLEMKKEVELAYGVNNFDSKILVCVMFNYLIFLYDQFNKLTKTLNNKYLVLENPSKSDFFSELFTNNNSSQFEVISIELKNNKYVVDNFNIKKVWGIVCEISKKNFDITEIQEKIKKI